MKIDPVSRQESTPGSLASGTAGAVFTASPGLPDAQSGDEQDAGSVLGGDVLSRLSWCVAWLFGLEAFFAEPTAQTGWQMANRQGSVGRKRD
ncbi:conserved hypothetical protein [Paraburkholderia tropica]|uniref:hypothetical protein n=1 Tax=Paraburkholderia TaxID=1822464 RepID=UPI001CB07C75|nr:MULTISPECIES: hypothetical protein [Paraburkholderia]CAG9213117.1 conserved hypothetical protein [Paraburkholderia tropica]